MAQFSKFFEIKLGTAPSSRYSVWAEPYLFVPSNLLGTTVSAPIFDRTEPESPRLLGVAGIDMVISAAEKTLMAADESLTDVIARSLILSELAKRARQRCPVVSNLGQCDVQAVRRYSGGEKLCAQINAGRPQRSIRRHAWTITNIRGRDLGSAVLFANDHWVGKSGRDRVCCGIGTSVKKNCKCSGRRPTLQRHIATRTLHPCTAYILPASS